MKKKLLLTTSNFPLSENDGQSQFMLEYAISLKTHFEVVVLAPKNRKAKSEALWNGIKIYRHKQSPLFNIQLTYGSGIMGNLKKNPLLIFIIPWFLLMQSIAIKRIVKSENIDLINAHWILPQGLTMAILKTLGFKTPYILNVHSGTFWHFGKFPLNLIRDFSLSEANSVTCVSEALTQSVSQIRATKTFHLPLGMDIKQFKPRDKNVDLIHQLHLENKKVIVFIGTMIRTKGVEHLLRAMKTIVTKFPETVLLMIGEGNLMSSLKNFVEVNNLKPNVIFTGKIDHHEIPKYLSVSHLLCIPSFMEGFPMVVKEALASNVLVLSTALPVFKYEPALEDIVFLISKVDEKELIEKTIEILTNIDSYEDRKIKGRKYIEKNANWTKLADDFKSISKNL